MKLGIHYPNNSSSYLNNLYAFQWSAITLLHFQMGDLARLRAAYPSALILVRAYLENWYITNPVGWAHQIAQWATDARSFTTHWTWANEQNLAVEGHPLGAKPGQDYPPRKCYEDIAAWNDKVVDILRNEVPWITLHYPANSQGHSDDQDDGTGYVGLEIQRSIIQKCRYLDVHTYWTLGLWNDLYYGRRHELIHRLFPEMLLFISECGTRNMNPGEIEAWLSHLPSSLQACFFIWDSDEANADWRLFNRSPVLDAFRHHLASSDVPTPVPPAPVPPVHNGGTQMNNNFAVALIKSYEKFSAKPYKEPNGTYSIGFGHNGVTADHPPITRDQAIALLNEDIKPRAQAVADSVKVKLTLEQYTALVSLVYNIGAGAFRGSDLLIKLNVSNYAGAAAEFERWVHGGMPLVVLPGLVSRRLQEKELFCAISTARLSIVNAR
jgi:lysozyme